MPKEAARILIVDDEPDLRELLGEVMRREGLTVEAAADGAEAFALAERHRPDLLIADLRLPDCNGLDVIDRLRGRLGDLPAVVITGAGDARLASEAVLHGCADFLTKPLDLPRLREAVRRGLADARGDRELRRRHEKRRWLAHALNRDRRELRSRLDSTGTALTEAYQTLNRQFLRQEAMIRLQGKLLACRDDDDVFRALFASFCERGDNLFGIALACDEKANLQIVGRFGTPLPDSLSICQALAAGLQPVLLEDPAVITLDGTTHAGLFVEWLRPQLVGLTLVCMPLLPSEGRLIGMVILYRKAEQPFTEDDMALAEMIAPSIAQTIKHHGDQPEAES